LVHTSVAVEMYFPTAQISGSVAPILHEYPDGHGRQAMVPLLG
jgi:hypothetical protein